VSGASCRSGSSRSALTTISVGHPSDGIIRRLSEPDCGSAAHRPSPQSVTAPGCHGQAERADRRLGRGDLGPPVRSQPVRDLLEVGCLSSCLASSHSELSRAHRRRWRCRPR
jgi:hypothetical protein